MRPLTFNTGYDQADYDALIATRQFAYAEVFTIEIGDVDGTILYYTNAQKNVTAPPVDGSAMLRTYVANDVLIDGLRFKASHGSSLTGGNPTTSLDVDEQTVTFYPDSNEFAPSMINGIPFLEAVGGGALDGAIIRRDRWVFGGPGSTPIAGMPMFYGLASSIDKLTRTMAALKVKSDIVLLNTAMPRNLYQPNCMYTVYDEQCGVLKEDFKVLGVVGASPSRVLIPWASATAQMTLGTIFFETGLNTNVQRTIRLANAGASLALSYPLPFVPLAGDQFAVFPGCDRTYTGGCVFFNNQARFRGYPFVPQPETAF